MMRLVRVELRRLFSRRLVLLAMVGALAASLLLLLGVWQSSQPMSAEELQFAEEMYTQELANWEENGEEIVAQCREDEAAQAEATGEEVDFECETWGPPQRDWYIWEAPPLEDSFENYLGTHAQLLVFAALLVGATFTAAELTTGSISTWLSFEPRRLRVYGSKLLAAAIGVVPLAVGAIAVTVAGVFLIAQHFDLAAGMRGQEWADVAWMALRSAGLAVVGALAGAALGFLLRHTAAVLGLAVVYLIGEQMLRSLVPASQPWLLGTNLNGWLLHGGYYYFEDCTTDATGTVCEVTEHALPFGHSALYLLVVVGLVAVLAAVAFRRRDAV